MPNSNKRPTILQTYDPDPSGKSSVFGNFKLRMVSIPLSPNLNISAEPVQSIKKIMHE